MNRTVMLILSALALLAASCASNRPTQFYTLSPMVTKTAAAPAECAVSVGPVFVPAALDRPQIVLQTGPNQVFIAEFDRWAAPLKEDIPRVVAHNLASLLGTSQVTVFPQLAASEASYRVVIDILQLESVSGKEALLDARWTVSSPKDGRSLSNRMRIAEPARGGGYAELVAAHSRAFAQLSGRIADTIREMEMQKP
ncbi:MAG: PqiC family protein [Smithellaceae bacterium]|nr:PqiC family protein [Smithellaceae bacterium]